MSLSLLAAIFFISRCQEGLLDNMVLGPNIAKNAALRENVFMMAICIELRIPLFLVGKPGSSKSLAKSIIQDSMHGQGSTSPVLRQFKQVITLFSTVLYNHTGIWHSFFFFVGSSFHN